MCKALLRDEVASCVRVALHFPIGVWLSKVSSILCALQESKVSCSVRTYSIDMIIFSILLYVVTMSTMFCGKVI